MAAASGVNVKALSIYFTILIDLVVIQGAQTVGSLLAIALIITPGAAATFVTVSPVKTIILSTIFAEFVAVGGIVFSLAPGVPVSVLVATTALVTYLFRYATGAIQLRKTTRDDVQTAKWSK